MGHFDPGGWNMDHVEDFNIWLPQFRHLGTTKRLGALATALRDYSYALSQRLYVPVEEDDLSDDEEPPAPLLPAPPTENQSIRPTRSSGTREAPLPPAPSTESQSIRPTRSSGTSRAQDEVSVVLNPVPVCRFHSSMYLSC